MADGTVGVREAEVWPGALLDNDQLTNDAGTTVQRQRVEDPELMMLLRQLRDGLALFAACVSQGVSTPSLRVSTMRADAAASTFTFTAFTNMAVTAWERVDQLPGKSGATPSTGQTLPAGGLLDPLAQLLSMNGVAVS